MITIKLPYKTSEENIDIINNIRHKYSSIVRYSYNRFNEGKKQKEIRGLIKKLNNVDIGSWLQQCGILEANQIKSINKDNKIIFGGKSNFKLRLNGKITKQEFKRKRLFPLCSQGDKLSYGNRIFDFSKLTDNILIFKPNRKIKIELSLPKLKCSYFKKLKYIQEQSALKELTVTVKLDEKYFYLTYDEPKTKTNNLKNNRYLGIDLNPDTIGISILENGQIIHTQEFSLKPIFDKILNLNLLSSSSRMKYYQNKLNFETIEISKQVSILAKHFNCNNVFIEDLKFYQNLTSEQKYNKLGNRKTRNLWKREKFIQNLTKRLNVLGIKIYSINPAYSSFIGNIIYNFSDAINASIEIARRGHSVIILKNKKFYPNLNLSSVKDQWKEYLTDGIKSWKDFYNAIKNSKVKYRVQLNETSFNCLSFKHRKSKVKVYNFN